MDSLDTVPVLISGLQHTEYRVTVSCLSTLCNLSSTPMCLARFAADEQLLKGLERVLTQNVPDVDPQGNAAQLMLNLCASYCFKRTASALGAVEECTVVSQTATTSARTATRSAQTASTSSMSKDMQLTATNLDMKSQHTYDSQSMQWTTSQGIEKATREKISVCTGAVEAESEVPESALPEPFIKPDPSELLKTALRVLDRANSRLDQEARENCVEVVLALLQRTETSEYPDAQVCVWPL
jgi:hypothetical protein